MLFDLVRRRTTVHHASGDVVVRSPSFRTAVTLLATMGPELAAAWGAWKKGKAAGLEDPLPIVLPLLTSSGRMAAVLDTYCDHARGPAAFWSEVSRNPGLRRDLLLAGLGLLADVRRAFEGLHLDKAFEGPDEPSQAPGEATPAGPGMQELAVALAAIRFGIDPLQVMEWPFEAWLTINGELLPVLEPLLHPEALQPGEHGSTAGQGVAGGLRLSKIPGVGYTKVGPGGGPH